MQSGVGGVAPRAGEEIAAELIRRRQKINQDELEFSILAAQFAETDEYDWQGFDSPHAWLKANCHLSGGAAGDRICVGEQLGRLGLSSAAMMAGEIGFAHFALIARTSAAVGQRLDQTALLRQARKHTIARFYDDCYHARHAADPKGCAKEEARSVEARSTSPTATKVRSTSTATSTRSGALLCARRWNRWPSGPARTITVLASNAWVTLLSSCLCVRSTTAWCRSGRTFR